MDTFGIVFLLALGAFLSTCYFGVICSQWENKEKWKTLTNLYKLHRIDNEEKFCGRALVGMLSLTEYILWHIGKILSNGKIFYVGGIIKNGYLLVCLSPFVLAWETIVSAGWLILGATWIIIGIMGFPLIILTALWAAFFELPADALNMRRETPKKQTKPRRRRTTKTKPAVIGELGVEKGGGKKP